MSAPDAVETVNPPVKSPLPAKGSAATAIGGPPGSAAPRANCRLTDDRGEAMQPVTVGQKFLLTCDPASVAQVDEPIFFKFPKEEWNFIIHPLDIKKWADGEVIIEVTSYKTGPFKDFAFVVSRGKTEFQTTPLSWEVQSVIENPNQATEFSAPPLKITWPLWFWAGLFILLVFLISGIVGSVQQRRQKKLLERKLREFDSPLSPAAQFAKESRNLQRRYTALSMKATEVEAGSVKELNELFRKYLLRKFSFSALDSSNDECMRVIKKMDKEKSKEYSMELERALNEINRATVTSKSVPLEDIQQLIKMSQKVIDLIETKGESKS